MIKRIKISNGELGEQAVQAASRRKLPPIDPEDEAAILLYASAGLTVENAINHFLSQKGSEIPLPEYRRAVQHKGDLATAIRELLKQLPSAEGAIPFEQMQRLYCYDDPDSEGLDIDASKRETLWNFKFSPTAVRETLTQWLKLLGELNERAGKGRPPITAQKDFVRELADWWRREVLADASASLGSSRADHVPPKRSVKSQRGLFATFVQTAATGIPGNQYLNWDQAIREISEEKR
jgi:hypothetical protein